MDIKLQLTAGAEQTCPATSCLQIPLQCDSVVSIRIFNPATPLEPYLKLCQDLPAADNICGLNRLRLPDGTVPNERLEVQVAVFPRSAVPRIDNQPVCPTSMEFSPSGKPTGLGQTAAIAGRAFYSPGDPQTVVDLGCTDLTLVSGRACQNVNEVGVTAAVNDFDSGVFLAPSQADLLSLSVGEPKRQTNPTTLNPEWTLAAQNLSTLARTVLAPVPGWRGKTLTRFRDTACVSVLEDGPQATSTVTCRAASPTNNDLDILAYRLSRLTLTAVLSSLRVLLFPDDGLVVGIVRDFNGNPAANIVVRSSAGSIQYINASRTDIGGASTSTSGMFVSTNAPFGTTYAANGTTLSVVGGLIFGKVTVVVLDLPPPPNQ
jgi:hypothetical protein